MNRRLVRGLGLLAAVLFLTGCFTDAATRLAYDIESGVNRMNRLNEARYSIPPRLRNPANAQALTLCSSTRSGP